MRLVRAGKVEILLCASLSGLGRSVPELVTVLRDLVTHKVALIISSAGIDTSKVPGKVLTDMLDAISEFKRALPSRVSAPAWREQDGEESGLAVLKKLRIP
jgi:DNA invertase Pin-like site-specific DNA recombinase